MSIIKGSNVILSFFDEEEWKPLACARSCSLITNSETGETSTLTSGNWRTYRAVKLNWNISFDGLVSFDMNMAVRRLRDVQFSLQPILISFDATDDNALTENYTGYIIVTSITTPSTYNGLYEYSGEGQGSGSLNIEEVEEECIAVGITAIALPDAEVGVAYSEHISFTGDAPFVVTPDDIPDWMDITPAGDGVDLTGTPAGGDVGTGIVVSFDVSNCEGVNTDSFSDTIDVEEEPPPPTDNVNWTYANDVGLGGRMRIIVDGITEVDTTVNASGSLLVDVGLEIIVIVNSTTLGTAETDITGPYTNSTSTDHITTDEFIVAAGSYDIDGRSLS